MGTLHVNTAYKRKPWRSGNFPDHQGIFNMWWCILCVAHIPSNYNMFPSSHAVKFHMFVEELLNKGNTFSCYECAEDSTEADSVESVEDRKGQDNGGRQAGEIKSGFDDFVFLA